MLHAAAQVKDLTPFLANRLAQLDISYHPPTGQNPLIGTRAVPTGAWATTLKWALLVPDPRHDTDALAAFGESLVTGPSPASAALLVRPDGHIAATTDDTSAHAVHALASMSRTQFPASG
jgi:hypothetical protein